MWKTILLVLLGTVLVAVGLGSPMVLIFPMWIFAYLLKDRIAGLLERLPLPVSFIGAGLLFGLLTEIFAIINNLSLPPEQRVLLNPDPAVDLFYGFFYYLFFIGAWYVLLRGINYSTKEIFLISGIIGIFVEETGAVFLRIFSEPMTGLLYAILILFVYGIFPMLALMVNEKKFKSKEIGALKRYLVALVALFIQWAIYGLIVLPVLKAIV